MNIIYTFCASLFITTAYSQYKIETIDSPNRRTILEQFSYTIKKADIYTAKIVGPNGEIIGSPVLQKEYVAGDVLQFNFQPKYFDTDVYDIIITTDTGSVDKISIGKESNRIEQSKKKNEQQKKQNRKEER